MAEVADPTFDPSTLGLQPAFSSSAAAISATPARVQSGNLTVLYYKVTINPGTGFQETFVVHRPNPPPTTPRPLLVGFHRFGVSALDIPYNTTMIQEAAKRGWFLVAPLGASGAHFSSLISQLNTEAVLAWMKSNFMVDETRIYGIGFSMGGGAVCNYAARHLDPTRPMLAAIVNHSGGVALKDTLFNDPSIGYIFDFWFGNGAAGSADPWEMARSSVINFDNATLQVDVGEDLARNLMHIGMRTVRASNDSIPYLSRQSDVLHGHMLKLGKQPGTEYGYYVLPYTGHSWTLLNMGAACDWLSQFTLQLPTSGSTLADQDGRYFDFWVTQDAQNMFSPFTWAVDGPANKLSILDTGNVRRIAADLPSMAVSTSVPLTVEVSTADGLADEIELTGWPFFPFDVRRDGQSVSGAYWSYDLLSKKLVLYEADGAFHTWTVVP